MTPKKLRASALAQRVLTGVDLARLTEVPACEPDITSPESNPSKYLDAERWVSVCARRAVALDLDVSPPLSVLDIGTGAGYFALVCRELGHRVIASDWSGREPLYRAITATLGIPVVDLDVRRLESLDVDVDLDLITAYMVTFNGHRTCPWGVAEWSFFIADALARLRPQGRLVLELNRELDGLCYTPEVEELFHARGAVITGPWPHPQMRGGARLVFTRKAEP